MCMVQVCVSLHCMLLISHMTFGLSQAGIYPTAGTYLYFPCLGCVDLNNTCLESAEGNAPALQSNHMELVCVEFQVIIGDIISNRYNHVHRCVGVDPQPGSSMLSHQTGLTSQTAKLTVL